MTSSDFLEAANLDFQRLRVYLGTTCFVIRYDCRGIALGHLEGIAVFDFNLA